MTTTTTSSSGISQNDTVLWVTYLNIVLYALSYQLQGPVEPFLIKKLSEEAGEGEDINRIYGNLKSFFQTIQMIGSPLVGILLDRIGIRYTSAVVFIASATCYGILSVAYDLNTLFLSKIPTMFQAAFLVAQATAATTTGNDAAARAAALGRMTTAYTIGATLGPTLGGYLANQGDYYIGAKVAVVGSLISVGLSLAFLPNETQPRHDASKTEEDKPALAKKGSFVAQLRNQISIGLRANLWPLLMVKMLGGVVASMHSTVMPLVMTQQLKFEPSDLGLSMSCSMMAVAAFGAVGMAPLTNLLGPPKMTYSGLLGRAVMGCVMAAVVSMNILAGITPDWVLVQVVPISALHALSAHTLATGLTTQTTGAVAPEEQGSLLGLEHSLFSMARIGGPKFGTLLLESGSGGLWPVEISCAFFDVLLTLTLVGTAAQTALKPKEK